jgi:dolichol-phosphate mannosyltransferase
MRVLVVIPTYNECENLPSLSLAVLGLPLGADLLVVDDNSPDGTGAVADRLAAENPRLRVLHRAGRQGLGSAYVTAFKRALAEGYDAVVTMDGDWSHDPAYLPDLIVPTGKHALVIGSRYLHGISVVNWSLARLILSQAANFYARTVAGLPFRDCTSGYQVVRHDALARIGLENVRTDGYSFLVELKHRVLRAGFSGVEVPIVFTQRRQGATKMTHREILRSVFTPWRLRLGLYRLAPEAPRPSWQEVEARRRSGTSS